MMIAGILRRCFSGGPGRAGWWLIGLLPLAVSAADANDEADKPVRVILNRWVDALGGARKIMHLKSVDYRCLINFNNGMPGVETEVRADARGVYRYDYELPTIGRLTQAFDGRFTWQRNDRLGFGQLSKAEHMTNLEGADFRSPLRAATGFSERRLLPDETIGGRQLQVIELVDVTGASGKWYFDPTTGMRVRVEVNTPAGPMIVEFSDFREVPGTGIKEAFQTSRTIAGHTMAVTMREIRYNDEVDPELFSAPRAVLEDNQVIERILFYNQQATGAAALQQVQTRVTKQLVEITTSGVKIPTTISQKRPNLMVMQQEVPGMGTVWQGYNGQVGWAWGELQGYRTMQGAELQQMLGTTDLEGPLQLSAICPLRRLLEETEDNGRRIVCIAMATLAGPVGNFYFDTKTYYLVRLETFVQAGANGQLKVIADFSDFRKVDGIMMPFRAVVTNPAMRMVTTIESVQHNQLLDDAIFKPRKEE